MPIERDKTRQEAGRQEQIGNANAPSLFKRWLQRWAITVVATAEMPKCRNADALNQSITLRLAIVVVEVLSIRTIQGREKVNARDNVTAEAQVAEGSVHIGIN